MKLVRNLIAVYVWQFVMSEEIPLQL